MPLPTPPLATSLAALLVALAVVPPATLGAQDSLVRVSRAEAVQAALDRGARLAVARADTAVAHAQLLTARALQNPTLSTTYSKSTPQYHVLMELPLDYPWLRRGRIGSAEAGRQAALHRFRYERAAVALDADTTYTRVLAALEHARLSTRNARDADSLRRMAVRRRDAGDASDLDVALATVNAGQQENVAAADSLSVVGAILDLQTVMGLPADRAEVVPADSLGAPPPTSPASAGGVTLAGSPLQIAAAQSAFESATLAAATQRRGVWTPPSLTFGVETGDPSGAEPGLLPTIGVALPLPLLGRNQGPIAQAEAERERARAELTLARVESRASTARALRQQAIALGKVERDRRLVAAAEGVAAMSLTAYREGASALPNVLEAQRNARDVLAQYVDDLASAWIATAVLRVLTLTTAAPVDTTP